MIIQKKKQSENSTELLLSKQPVVNIGMVGHVDKF